MSDHYDAEPVVREVVAYRRGWWIEVRLDGDVVYRRLTRDPAFTIAWVRFYSNRSPSVPRSRLAFQDVVLLGEAWRGRARRAGSFYNNSLEVPIGPSLEEAPVYAADGHPRDGWVRPPTPALQEVAGTWPAPEGPPF